MLVYEACEASEHWIRPSPGLRQPPLVVNQGSRVPLTGWPELQLVVRWAQGLGGSVGQLTTASGVRQIELGGFVATTG